MKRYKKVAPHVAAAALLTYHHVMDSLTVPPRMPECPQCHKKDVTAFYAIGWCDSCAATVGYLPPDHRESETRFLFKALRDHATNVLGATWEQQQNLVTYWRANKLALLDAQFGPDLMSLALAPQTETHECLWQGCKNLLGSTAVAGFCGTTCYARNYRMVHKEDIKEARRLRNMKKTFGDA